MNLVGEFISDYLNREDMSMRELARRMDMKKAHSRISRVISGENQPNLEFLDRLALATGEDLGKLAAMALGRPVQFSTDEEARMRRLARLSSEVRLLNDILVAAMDNIDNPSKLESVVVLLQKDKK